MEHVNTLAPAGLPDKPHAVWALLHNLGPSKLVLADLATGERLREIRGVGTKSHGLVPWDGGFLILNSGEGQLCRFTPPGEEEGPEAIGQLDVLWVGELWAWGKGLGVEGEGEGEREGGDGEGLGGIWWWGEERR